jgi:hypothetical protein
MCSISFWYVDHCDQFDALFRSSLVRLLPGGLFAYQFSPSLNTGNDYIKLSRIFINHSTSGRCRSKPINRLSSMWPRNPTKPPPTTHENNSHPQNRIANISIYRNAVGTLLSIDSLGP